MIKKVLMFAALLMCFRYIHGQGKPLIDTTVRKWPYISRYDVGLSNNGQYATYIIFNQPVGANSLVIQHLRGQWKKTIIRNNIEILFFSSNNHYLCWKANDSIWLQKTGEEKCRLLGITSRLSYPADEKGKWIALPANNNESQLTVLNINNGQQLNFSSIKSHEWLSDGNSILLITHSNELKIFNLLTQKEFLFTNVKDYVVPSCKKSILLTVEKEKDMVSLQWVNLKTGISVTIWSGLKGEKAGGYVYDAKGEQLAFNVQKPDGKVTIWYYKVGQPEALLKLSDQMTGFSEGLRISEVRDFSGSGRWLLFNVRKQLPLLSNEVIIGPVDIWSYRDEELNPAQTEKIQDYHDYAVAVEVDGKTIQLLEQQDDERVGVSPNDHLILYKGGPSGRGSRVGNWWPHNGPASVWLLSLEDGKRKLIRRINEKDFGISCFYSPGGRWAGYWDSDRGHYFSINPQTGQSINLTGSLPVTVVENIGQGIGMDKVGEAGWYADDSAFLVYDNHDIWKLDPAGKKAPVNITGGYGRENGIRFRIVNANDNGFRCNEELLLSGYNDNTKWNGFFTIRLDKPGSPQLLTMGPYTYYQTTIYRQPFGEGMPPLSGGEGKDKRWLVMRESDTEYPNFFISKDLKQFIPLTNLQPHKSINWLTTEAVSWRMYNGQVNSGVLYKPENFDATKKYPIIFNYYEKYSQRCYQFPMPGLTESNINIPWFVSRGYLVFTPDIQYTTASKPKGMTISEAAYNAVASAAEYLSQRPYVEKSKMAIQGHSFGGHETNAIITQTNLFAAAAEVAGYSDHISAYLGLTTGENSPIEKDHKIDHSNQRMGATPWERPELFRRNSPVINADKVVTPLLIVHNKKDGAVNFRQGVEMYMALRRLGKPCWLLQYDNSGHVLTDKNDALDYTIRLTQYFDHYLKGAPAPQWMTMNTLAAYKGKNNLYTLDTAGNCMKDCKVCKQWNSKQTSTTSTSINQNTSK